MMFNIIGLSHLVFTVNKKPNFLSGYFKSNFDLLLVDEIDHYEIKLPMLRNKKNKLTKLSLYKSSNNLFPGVEFIESIYDNKRPISSFGLIDKSLKYGDKLINKLSIDGYELKCIFDKEANLNICYETNLIHDKYGCWFKVSNFEEQIDFFERYLGVKSYFKSDSLVKFKTVSVNKSFSSFHIIIVKGDDQFFFNDDLGISSIGWFSKNLTRINKISNFNLTDQFKLNLSNKKFIAQFAYDNKGISHEILKI